MVRAANRYLSREFSRRDLKPDPIAAMLHLFSKRRHRPDPAASLYATAVEAARNRVFYTRLGVPDTLDGRFDMLCIMLHAVCRRLVHGEDPDPAFLRRITEHFVVDMDSNLRDMGVSDVRMAKKMKTLFGAYGGRIAAYDIALASGGDALEKAVARNIFPGGAPEGAAAALAAYIRAANAMLAGMSTAAIGEGRIGFPDPGDFMAAAVTTRPEAC